MYNVVSEQKRKAHKFVKVNVEQISYGLLLYYLLLKLMLRGYINGSSRTLILSVSLRCIYI